MKIFVLAGQGINSEPVMESLQQLQQTPAKGASKFQAIYATPGNLLDILGDPETVAGFIPGGDSSQETRAQIGEAGMRALHRFVAIGGGALTGICKGGYMLGESVVYGSCFPAQHRKQSRQNINLIQATYYGPLTHLLLDYAFKHPDKPCISLAKIHYGAKRMETPIVYWHGGVPLLEPGQTELRALARFCDPLYINVSGDLCKAVDPIAIGVKDFPDSGGKAISSSVHPEVSGDYLDKYVGHMAVAHKHYAALQTPYGQTARILTENGDKVFGLFRLMVDEMLDCGRARNLANKPLAGLRPSS